MNVVDGFPMTPNCCYYCRTTDTPVLDLQRDDEDNPNRVEHIYLCATCLTSGFRMVAPSVGLAVVDADEIAAYQGALEDMRGQVSAAVAERDAAVAVRDSLVASYGKLADPSPEPESGRRARGGVTSR